MLRNILSTILLRKKTISTLLLMIILLGTISYATFPKEEMPEIDLKTVAVIIKYDGMSSNEIEKLIRLAIAESNKNKNSTNFALTPEGRIVSSNFQANRGRLPWPVKEGVIVRRFGTQPHPIVRTTTINSDGISIATSPNSLAYSVFDGEVLSVYGFSGGNPGVLIRHGKYISNYQNLSSIFVKKGDKINANDEIGIVFTNESNGKTILKFNIFNELKPENPVIWLDN